MKKRIFVLLSVFIAAIIVFAGCAKPLTENARLSELRTDILTGEGGGFKVVAVTGMRENPFNIDGISQAEKTYFTVITVTPEDKNPLAEYEFSVTVGGQTTSGKFVRHPFNETYSAEINRLSEGELTLVVSGGEAESEIALSSVKTENYIDSEKAFSIAEKKLSAKLSEHSGVGYEIFVRLIENPISSDGGYYWYVAFIFENDKTCAVLIEPVTMEIAAVRD